MNKDLSNYIHFSGAMIELATVANETNVDIQKLLNKFYKELKEIEKVNYCNGDIKPEVESAYRSILLRLPYDDAKESFCYVFDNYNIIIEPMTVFALVSRYQQMRDFIFDKIYTVIINESANKNDDFFNKNFLFLEMCLRNANEENQRKLLDKIFSFPKNILKILYSYLMPNLYVALPKFQKEIFDFIVSYPNLNTKFGLVSLYYNLSRIVEIDYKIVPTSLKLIEEHISNPKLDKEVVEYIIKILKPIYMFPEYRERTIEIFEKIKENNSLYTLDNARSIARITGDTQILRSTFMLGKRVEKTSKNPFGFMWVREIPVDEPSVLFLGGNGTINVKSANGYMNDVEGLLKNKNIKEDIGIYCVIYNFGDETHDPKYAFHDDLARNIYMYQNGRRRAKTRKIPNEEDKNPHYIELLFKNVFLPRLSHDGHKISVEQAIKNIRNINIVAHCHGGYTFLKLEEEMQKKMAELGYTKEEMSAIQKQLLCVGFAPFCPLGISKSTFISFATAKDTESRYYNYFDSVGRKIILEEKPEISFFPEKQGNVFIVSDTCNGTTNQEHGFCLKGSDSFQNLSKEGIDLIELESNAIVNGIRSSLSHTNLPSVKELVAGDDKDLLSLFYQANVNGKDVYEKMLFKAKLLRERISRSK